MSGLDDDEEIAGEELALILRGPSGQVIADALVGCGFYRDDPNQPAQIVRCEAGSGRLSVQLASGQVRSQPIATGYVLVNPALRAALDQAITPGQREDQKLRAEVAAFGFVVRVESQDLQALAAGIRSAREGRIPSAEERRLIMLLAEKYGEPRTVARLTSGWIDADDAGFLPDVLIVLVSALRHSGRTPEALARTDVLAKPGRPMSESERRILFTERAAVLADRYEQTSDPSFLQEARKSANRSWAIGPSDHCSMVYQRLKSLERQAGLA